MLERSLVIGVSTETYKIKLHETLSEEEHLSELEKFHVHLTGMLLIFHKNISTQGSIDPEVEAVTQYALNALNFRMIADILINAGFDLSYTEFLWNDIQWLLSIRRSNVPL